MRFIICIFIYILSIITPTLSYGMTEVKYHKSLEIIANKKEITHTVEKGESISSILKNYKISLKQFLKDNPQLNGTDLSLSLGQRLIITRKYMNSSTDSEINHDVRVYLDGLKSKKPAVDKNTNSVESNSNVNRYVHKEDDQIENYENDAEEVILTGEPFRSLDGSEVMKVALLLPLKFDDGSEDEDFVSFYKGTLLAINKLKESGRSVDLKVFDTGEGLSKTVAIMRKGELKNMDIVIGPVYEDQFSVVAADLSGTKTIVVSPLTSTNSYGKNIYQLAPIESTRYDKIEGFFDNKNIINITTNADDTVFYNRIAKMMELRTFGVEFHLYEGELEHSLSEEEMKLEEAGIVADMFFQRMDSLRQDTVHYKDVVIDSLFMSEYMYFNIFMADSIKIMDKEANTISMYDYTFYSNGKDHRKFINDGDMTKDEIFSRYIKREIPNVIVVSAKEPSDIEKILSKVVNIRKRFGNQFDISIVGSSTFAHQTDDIKEDYFSGNTFYITNFHVDRLDKKVSKFDREYIDMFGEKPNLFTYRAYDVMSLFPLMLFDTGANFSYFINDELLTVLQTSYRFVEHGDKRANNEWVLVNYKKNYSIEIK